MTALRLLYVGWLFQFKQLSRSAFDSLLAILWPLFFATLEKTPLYYSEVAEKFGAHAFVAVTRALGSLHAQEKLWQDPRGRMCVRGSEFAAKPPRR